VVSTSPPNGGGRSSSRRVADDDWGPATPVYSSYARTHSDNGTSTNDASTNGASTNGATRRAPVSPPPLTPARRRSAEESLREVADRLRPPNYPSGKRPSAYAPVAGPTTRAPRMPRSGRHKASERGLPGWAALLILIGIAGLGGLIDTATNLQVRGFFNVGIVVASTIAILAVRRSDMLPVVLAPPIVYSLAAMFMLYVRSGGLHNRHEVINAALNYLVYGFPAIAIATGVVLVIAAIRLIARR